MKSPNLNRKKKIFIQKQKIKGIEEIRKEAEGHEDRRSKGEV